MADIIDLMLATGCRIGQVLALRWSDISLDGTRPTLTVNGTIKTERGKGTYRKATPKSDASVRTIALPEFAVTMLRRRRAESDRVVVLSQPVCSRTAGLCPCPREQPQCQNVALTYHRRRRQPALGRLTPIDHELSMTATATHATHRNCHQSVRQSR